MTKSELRTGMIVTTRNGYEYMVFLNTTIPSCEKDDSFVVAHNGRNWNYLSRYNEDLTNNTWSSLDIVKVERPKNPWDLTTPNCKTEVLWERPKKKQYTYEQLKEILGTEFEVIG